MFCPKCGNECVEGAQFCPKCGYKIGERTAGGNDAPKPVANSGIPVKPVMAIVAVAIVVGIGCLAFNLVSMVGRAARGPLPASAPAPAEKHSVDSAHGSSSASEEAPTRISPKEDIKVSDIQLKEDAVKRYVLTGTVTNTSTETYDVLLGFAADVHASDKYGEHTTSKTGLTGLDTTTEYARTSSQGSGDGGGSVQSVRLSDYLQNDEFNHSMRMSEGSVSSSSDGLKLHGVGPGERVPFAVYPHFRSIEEYLDNPQCFVAKVTLPDADVDWRYDREGKIEVKSAKLTADGKAEIEFVNNTGMYLDKVGVTFVCYNDEDIPAVKDNNGARPSGAVVKTSSVTTLKPGDSSKFVEQVGEGYKKIEVKDIIIVPDKDKNSFN